MAKYRILVVEDELIVSKDIQQSLIKLGYEIAGASKTAEDALEKAKAEMPDLILMDIMLKGEMNGIEAADIIKKELGIPVIFLTAYADENTINKAKKSEPYGYLIKPFKDVELQTTIEIVLYRAEKERESKKENDMLLKLADKQPTENKAEIFFKSKNKLVKVILNEITYIEAHKDYVSINTNKEKHTILATMAQIEQYFENTNICRAHRSFFININKINSLDSNFLKLEGAEKLVPIGSNYKEDLMSKLNIFGS
jgi:DNA-binding LytR/AlgR family response regulator